MTPSRKDMLYLGRYLGRATGRVTREVSEEQRCAPAKDSRSRVQSLLSCRDQGDVSWWEAHGAAAASPELAGMTESELQMSRLRNWMAP